VAEYIGVYRVERRIGHGGMGEVFLAWDERLDRPVAIKRIRHEELSEIQRERFRREAQTAARLSHPAIVQVHDLVAGEEFGDAIVFEYVEGQTLGKQLAAGAPSLPEALRLGREIAEGLAAAHEAGLIHRDLKADNVIVTPSGHAKILDFGLARPVASKPGDPSLTREGMVVGTCHAMSPEQATGGEMDERSDLFSFGALLYEMLTGRAPFRGKDTSESLKKVVVESPPPLKRVRPDVPQELSDLLEWLLAKRPEARPRYARHVAETLGRLEAQTRLTASKSSASALMSGEMTAAFPVVPGRERAAAGRRVRRIGVSKRIILLTAAMVLAVALAAIWLFRSQKSIRLQRPATLQSSLGTPQPVSAPEPIRIVVVKPVVKAEGDSRVEHEAAALTEIIVNTLWSSSRFHVFEDERSAEEAANYHRAEAIGLEITDSGSDNAVVRPKRYNSDGSLLKMLTPITMDLEKPEGSEQRLRKELSLTYSIPLQPEMAPVDTPEYDDFLEIQSRLNSGKKPVNIESDLNRLKSILQRFPSFHRAGLLATRYALASYRYTRDPNDLKQAQAFAQKAANQNPDDIYALTAQFKVAVVAGDFRLATDLLNHLEELWPGDPENQVLRAQLERQQGNLEAVIHDMNDAVRRADSWENRYWLADALARVGRISDARDQLNKILAQSPNNPWAFERKAYIELLFGSPIEAAQLYRKLIKKYPKKRNHHTNLAMALSLQGDDSAARDEYIQAYHLEPKHAITMLNFAEQELKFGDSKAAQTDFQQTLRRFDEIEASAPLSPGDKLAKAQCLARLEQFPEAIELTAEVVRQNPKDPEILQNAATVYALANRRDDVLRCTREALRGGLSPGWFKLPVFKKLRHDPEFQKLVQ
jgi:serine/threonine-protein kinase